MERGVRVNGEDYYYSTGDGCIGVASYSSASALPRVVVADAACDGSVGGGGGNYIEHHVSKFDTLAGVAIRYGVEVADIKRINGLVSDLQMFARKTLKIPLPGRHPPSPSMSNGFDKQGASISEQTPPNHRHSDLFDSFQSLKLKPSTQQKASPAMSSLQGHYGPGGSYQKAIFEGFEMATYQGISNYLDDDGPSFITSPMLNPPLNPHRKCKSVSNGFLIQNGHLVDYESNQETKDNGSDRSCEKSFRRRQKSEADFTRTHEMILKDDNSNGSGFSPIACKGLALRPNSASRTAIAAADSEASLISPISIGSGDSLVSDSLDRVRKSSSASNLQDSDSSPLASLWPTSKWSLTDFQALSTAAITRSIFDGLPNPISGRRNKAALD
ncbi:uncharacterized protein LOC116005158 [Ipomoea triloba]|uniref:uncharacterized protein LOC116005158 n=1 Tax=Ipomoea triloba TaxID=35885 RepID=UPI00125D928B|nr:uncharacterized protein LOC116005158 [Ipomoea triloba]GMD20814.1 LysM and putative peptidoglycan-binding domain-containing protein [Ipomoea batatas]